MNHFASPEWTWIIMIIVFGLIIAYAMMKARKRSRAEKQTTEAATKEVYRQEDQ
jgi:hypothetical protein